MAAFEVIEADPKALERQLDRIAVELTSRGAQPSDLNGAVARIRQRLLGDPIRGASTITFQPLVVAHSTPATADNFANHLVALCEVRLQQKLVLILQYRLV
jgi:hypothetical protein